MLSKKEPAIVSYLRFISRTNYKKSLLTWGSDLGLHHVFIVFQLIYILNLTLFRQNIQLQMDKICLIFSEK